MFCQILLKVVPSSLKRFVP
uniref:Uncharacterized protein n=1 Tax=Arundo donax TaxID=35708 RepID=A0A0A9APB1_ARUDO